MAEHPAVKVTLLRFVEKEGLESNGVVLQPSPYKSPDNNYSFSTATMKINRESEKELDEGAMAEFQSKWEGVVGYTERVASNIVEAILAIGRSREYDLVVVGKGRSPSTTVAELADRQAEHAELGPIGDIFASSGQGVVASVLVVQQHDLVHVDEVTVSKVMQNDNEISEDIV